MFSALLGLIKTTPHEALQAFINPQWFLLSMLYEACQDYLNFSVIFLLS